MHFLLSRVIFFLPPTKSRNGKAMKNERGGRASTPPTRTTETAVGAHVYPLCEVMIYVTTQEARTHHPITPIQMWP
jgi:hypothetical protein